jgi:hypothetical protein
LRYPPSPGTLPESMALAARRDPAARAAARGAEGRTACPVCGGSIHPVAGRCKHCRADLVKLRELPAGGGAVAVPPPFPVPTAPVMLGAPPAASWWRRWPLVVTIVAAVAIIVCVGILMSGESRSEPRRRRSAAPPMDRMDTDPLPERVDRIDPWQGSDRGAGSADSAPDPAPTPLRDPDSPWPPPDTPAPDTADPGPGATTVGPPAEDFFGVLTRTTCRHLTSCGMGSLAGAPLADLCEQITAADLDLDVAERLRTGQCRYDGAAAARCLRAIEQEPCSTQTMDIDQIARRLMSIGDCGVALQCP